MFVITSFHDICKENKITNICSAKIISPKPTPMSCDDKHTQGVPGMSHALIL